MVGKRFVIVVIILLHAIICNIKMTSEPPTTTKYTLHCSTNGFETFLVFEDKCDTHDNLIHIKLTL